MRQTELDLRVEKRGGKRKNAGRKRVLPRVCVPHRARPAHDENHPVHVTMRAAVSGLRAQALVRVVVAAIARASKDAFRVVHFSVQNDHVHLIVEALDKRALTAGMRGLAVRLARRVNPKIGRSGALWADRYHARELTGPRSVRNALVYVLGNHKKHDSTAYAIDPCASGAWFSGWSDDWMTEAAFRDAPVRRLFARPPPIAEPSTWLAKTGWRTRGGGPLRVNEQPLRAS